MNDRIQKLASKAGLINRKFMFGRYYQDDLTDEQKKFAELVVKDCAKIIEEVYGKEAAAYLKFCYRNTQ